MNLYSLSLSAALFLYWQQFVSMIRSTVHISSSSAVNATLQELASPQAFKTNPSLVWEFYHYRREVMRSKDPNPVSFMFFSRFLCMVFCLIRITGKITVFLKRCYRCGFVHQILERNLLGDASRDLFCKMQIPV